jgi:hypothetical protein
MKIVRFLGMATALAGVLNLLLSASAFAEDAAIANTARGKSIEDYWTPNRILEARPLEIAPGATHSLKPLAEAETKATVHQGMAAAPKRGCQGEWRRGKKHDGGYGEAASVGNLRRDLSGQHRCLRLYGEHRVGNGCQGICRGRECLVGRADYRESVYGLQRHSRRPRFSFARCLLIDAGSSLRRVNFPQQRSGNAKPPSGPCRFVIV